MVHLLKHVAAKESAALPDEFAERVAKVWFWNALPIVLGAQAQALPQHLSRASHPGDQGERSPARRVCSARGQGAP